MKANELDMIEVGMIVVNGNYREIVIKADSLRYYYKSYRNGVLIDDGHSHPNNPRSWDGDYLIEFVKSYQFNSLYQKLL